MDELLESYLEDLELSEPDLREGLQRAIASGDLIPVVLTSAHQHVGAEPLLDVMVRSRPPYRLPHVRDEDGASEELPKGTGFVGEVVARQRTRDGDPVTWIKVWSGTPPNGKWAVLLPDGPPASERPRKEVRVRKLYRIRGPRRATAPSPGRGALVAVFESLDVAVGTTLTDGTRLQVIGPRPPSAQAAWWVRGPLAAAEAFQRSLERVVEADVGLSLRWNAVFGATLLCGASDGHLKLAVQRVSEACGYAVTTELPPVAYVEVPAEEVAAIRAVHEVRGEHGLVSEFGSCEIALRPRHGDVSMGTPLRFLDHADDEEELPSRFRPAIGEGSEQALQNGPLAGYPVAGVEVCLVGGAYDILCSTEEHFREAGRKAMRTALAHAGTRLFEPWCEVDIQAPQVSLGELLADLAAHRGRVVGMEVVGDTAELKAHCPYREMRTFSGRLQALTAGRGTFVLEETHHEPVPEHLVAEAIEASPFRRTC